MKKIIDIISDIPLFNGLPEDQLNAIKRIAIDKKVNKGETIFSETMSTSEVIDWSPAVSPGEYIVVVHATWKQGVVSYWFSVPLNNCF